MTERQQWELVGDLIALSRALNRAAAALMDAEFSEPVVCGRSYDGKCPMPRPEPGLTPDTLEEALEDWKAAVAASPNPEQMKPLDPRRVTFREHLQEQQVGSEWPGDCRSCGTSLRGVPEKQQVMDGLGSIYCSQSCADGGEKRRQEVTAGIAPPVCAFCDKPVERGNYPRLLLDAEGRIAHVECWQAQRVGQWPGGPQSPVFGRKQS